MGGIACLIIIYIAAGIGESHSQAGLFITAGFYIVFSIVSLYLLPMSPASTRFQSFLGAVKTVQLKQFFLPLIAIWLINEAIDVFIFFGPLLARTNYGVSISAIGLYLLIIQFIAFPATWLFGAIGRKFGTVNAIFLSVIIWVLVVVFTAFSRSILQLSLAAFSGSLVIGSTQALLRAYYSDICKREHAGLAFGFYSIAARSAAIIGPLTYGAVSLATGSQNYALLLTIIPFSVGMMLLLLYTKNQVLTQNNSVC